MINENKEQMKDLEELREDIILLKNIGTISKEVEMVLLHKLNSIEKQLTIPDVVEQSKQLSCKCDYPIIRTSVREYCSICQLDLK